MKAPRPNNSDDILESIEAFYKLVWTLRENCPWDKKQTNKSIAHLTIEEAYEILDALENNDDEAFAGELGDVLLHIFLHSVIAEQRGAFKLTDIIAKVHEKMIHRHPHVFGNVEVKNEDEVVQNWEKLKQKEGRSSVLEGVPNSLPALLKAERIQHKASKVGFDWDSKEHVWDKVFEEVNELKEAIDNNDIAGKKEEFGDLLFALVNAARHEKIVPEESLHHTNNKFIKRFQYIEKRAEEMNISLDDMTLEEMDKIWDEAKKV